MTFTCWEVVSRCSSNRRRFSRNTARYGGVCATPKVCATARAKSCLLHVEKSCHILGAMNELEYVRGKLAAPGVNLREVAEGAGVKERWLRMLAAGEIPEPGYNKVRALAEYFGSFKRSSGNKPQQAAAA